MSKILRTIEDLVPDPQNANKGCERGDVLIQRSLEQYGAGRSIVAESDGVVLCGNKTLEQAAQLGFPIRVVKTDGKELVVVQRTDLKYDDARAKELALSDNRSAEVSMTWDVDVLRELQSDGVDLSGMWSELELETLFSQNDDEEPIAPNEFHEIENVAAEHTCPSCGYKFSGKGA